MTQRWHESRRMVTKRQLGVALSLMGLGLVGWIVAVDRMGLGRWGGFGPLQRIALGTGLMVLVVGLLLVRIGNRPA